ncbi:MAG: hypothetical protein CW338_01535 [Clostridiales bacterium]|nr:hypothetical protein [Clostridiales bacterium]
MRVKYTALILALLLLLPFAANAAGFSVRPAEDVSQAQLDAALGTMSDLYMTVSGEAPDIILTVTWHDDIRGRDLEMVICGLGTVPAAAQARQMAACVQLGVEFDLTAVTRGVIVDAEKRNTNFPNAYYSPVVSEPEDALSVPGDSFLCWAATASNMLYMSGWSQKAAEDPLTGKAFGSEDDVFYLLLWCRHNAAGFIEDGVRWFLYEPGSGPDGDEGSGSAGEDDRDDDWDDDWNDDGSDDRDALGGLVPDAVCDLGTAGTEDDALPPQKAPGILQLIKKAYSLGLTLSLYEYSVAITGDDEFRAFPSKTGNGYSREDYLFPDPEDVAEDRFFTILDDGTCVPLTKSGDHYRDADGTVYPAVSVFRGFLYDDPETGRTFPVLTMSTDMSEPEYWFCNRVLPADESDLDFSDAGWEESTHHAVTCKGYVMDLSGAAQPVTAILVSDSDDDAKMNHLTPANAARSSRPDTVRLHFVTCREDENGDPALYMDTFYRGERNTGKQAKLLCITWLESCSETEPVPVPLTGDTAPGLLLRAALTAAALCGMAVCLSLRRKMRK